MASRVSETPERGLAVYRSASSIRPVPLRAQPFSKKHTITDADALQILVAKQVCQDSGLRRANPILTQTYADVPFPNLLLQSKFLHFHNSTLVHLLAL